MPSLLTSTWRVKNVTRSSSTALQPSIFNPLSVPTDVRAAYPARSRIRRAPALALFELLSSFAILVVARQTRVAALSIIHRKSVAYLRAIKSYGFSHCTVWKLGRASRKTPESPGYVCQYRRDTTVLNAKPRSLAAEPKKCTDFWFKSGDFVVIAKRKMAYRVHGDILGRKSKVFNDLLNPDLPRPEVEEMMEGCPIVHITDTPKDFFTFLKLIYDGFEYAYNFLGYSIFGG